MSLSPRPAARRSRMLLLGLLVTFGCFAAIAAPSLSLPPFRRTVLPNGLTLLLMEQHEVPLVSLHLLFQAGSVRDPAGQEGLASVTAELLRRGTARRSADQISAELDFIGATFALNATLDHTSANAEFMAKDLEAGLDLVADVIRNPTFPAAEVDKVIRQRIDSLKEEKDDPPTVIRKYFRAALFGDHPYGRPVDGDERSVGAISRDAITAFHRNHFQPRSTILAVVGDFESGRMEERLKSTFGNWPEPATAAPAVAPPPAPARFQGRKLILVDKPDSTQTFFMIGNVGVARTDPDRVGITAVNTLFGGRFTSLLNSALRIESGLTYGAMARFEQLRVPGAFYLFSYTPNESTAQAIDTALGVLGRWHSEGISAEQLASARAYIKGQHPPRLETSGQLAELLTDLEFSRLGPDEVDRYFPRLDAVTRDDATRILRHHYPKDDLLFVLIGRAAAIQETVRKYAPRIDVLPISRPGYR